MDAFQEYKVELGHLPKTLYTDCKPKLFGTKITSFLNLAHCKLRADLGGLQTKTYWSNVYDVN